MKTTAIVVMGLPASGKTSLARQIAKRIGWPLLDKDSVLEQLFEENEVTCLEDRRRLSKLSDVSFRAGAEDLDYAVLVSHWRPRVGPFDTGTPTDWIIEHFENVIEVHCVCTVETSVSRFRARKRHRSHLDTLKTHQDVKDQIESLAQGYPLGLAATLSVNTEGEVDFDEILDQLRVKLTM